MTRTAAGSSVAPNRQRRESFVKFIEYGYRLADLD